MTPIVWDTHVHLDFMRNAPHVAREADEQGLGLCAVTVTPAGYERLDGLAHGQNVQVGMGLHPWWVADGRCGAHDVEHATELVRSARFVGEVGLDFSPKHVPDGSAELQLAAFESIARACAEASDPHARKVLSIHSVRAAGTVLDVLEQTGCLAACHCIFHWFSGTSDELYRALRAGCLVSVNEMMLRTRRGREYARQLPAERLLLETDLPPGEDVPYSASEILAQLERTVTQLTQIRGSDSASITRLTCENTSRIFE